MWLGLETTNAMKILAEELLKRKNVENKYIMQRFWNRLNNRESINIPAAAVEFSVVAVEAVGSCWVLGPLPQLLVGRENHDG